jgi:hypothetical protein
MHINQHQCLSMQSSLWLLFFSLFFVTSHFAFNSTPPYVPYQSRVEYWLDSGAYHLVDVPYHHQVPNPTLRILITIYSFALLFLGIHCVQFCAVCCCATHTAASAPSSTLVYVRTDTYLTLEDATNCRHPISSHIIKVDGRSIVPLQFQNRHDISKNGKSD